MMQLLSEPRSRFDGTDSSACEVLADMMPNEVVISRRWDDADECVVSVSCDPLLVKASLFPGGDPSSSKVGVRRARYMTVRGPDGAVECFVITGAEVAYENGVANVTLNGRSPVVWMEMMPSAAIAVDGSDWSGTFHEVATNLSRCVSNYPEVLNMRSWQRLPVLPLSDSWSPSTAQRADGFVALGEIGNPSGITIGTPVPMPVREAYDDLMATTNATSMSVVYEPDASGPFWRWAMRRRLTVERLFSESDGTLVVKGNRITWQTTEGMAYSSKDRTLWQFAGGDAPLRTKITGPWFGVVAESATPTATSNAESYLRARARSITARVRRMTIECAVTFGEAEPVSPGTIVSARIGDTIYKMQVDEVVSSWSQESGWTNTSDAVIAVDTLDLPVSDDTENDIVFAVNGTQFIVPCSQYGSNAYSWVVTVDDEVVGTFDGASSDGHGITLNFSRDGAHIVRLTPSSGEYTPGWGRAFGFRLNGNGCNAQHNKSKLVNMLSDPDLAHLQSEQSAGDDFRREQFSECVNLAMVTAEDMPDTVTDLGAYFRWAQYYRAYSIVEVPDEHLSASAVSCGREFRGHQYGYVGSNSRMLMPGAEHHPDSLVEIGDDFRRYQYESAWVSRSADAAFSNTATEVSASNFRYKQYTMSAVSECGAEASPSALQSITGAYYMREQYYGCGSLLAAADEGDTPALSSVTGMAFRFAQYHQCGALERQGAEATAAQLRTVGDSYRWYQYAQSGVIDTAAEGASGLVSVGNNYRDGMFRYCSRLDGAAMEASANQLVSVGSFYRTLQYDGSGCTSASAEGAHPALRTVGERFRKYQYANTPRLVSSGGEAGIGTAMTMTEMEAVSVGAFFREGQYENSAVSEFAGEADVVCMSLPQAFRYRQFANTYNADTAGYETGFATTMDDAHRRIATVGDYYRAEQWAGSGVVTPANEGVVSCNRLGNYFRHRMFYQATRLSASAVEAPFTHAAEQDRLSASIGENYRRAEYEGSKVVSLSDEAVVAAGSIGQAYRSERFAYCPNIRTTALMVAEVTSNAPNLYRVGEYRGSGVQTYIGHGQVSEGVYEEQKVAFLSLGTGYMADRFQDSDLRVAAHEPGYVANEAWNVTDVGSDYRKNMFKGCARLAKTAGETPMMPMLSGNPNVMYYRAYQYQNSGVVDAVGGETDLSLWDAWWFDFRNSQFEGCQLLTNALIESNVKYAPGASRVRQYYGCSALVTISTREGALDGTDGSREEQFGFCTSLTRAQDESVDARGRAIDTKSPGHRRQYVGCVSLTQPAREHHFGERLTYQINREEQYLGCTALGATAVGSRHVVYNSYTDKDTWISEIKRSRQFSGTGLSTSNPIYTWDGHPIGAGYLGTARFPTDFYG